jgi:hypothetical protein
MRRQTTSFTPKSTDVAKKIYIKNIIPLKATEAKKRKKKAL